MNFAEESKRLLAERWENADALRREYPELSELLKGEFGKDDTGEYKFNTYKKGRVLSRPLDGKTVGLIRPGECYHFPTGDNTETMTVLEGILEASVNDKPLLPFQRGDEPIEAPHDTTLNLNAVSNVFYVCQYTPK